jgi:hypothetical protein
LYCILDREEYFTIRNAYTPEVCTQITWAIIDDGHSFFGQNTAASDFAPEATHYFSMSFLEGITNAICNALIIQRATFPRKWTSQATTGSTHGGT